MSNRQHVKTGELSTGDVIEYQVDGQAVPVTIIEKVQSWGEDKPYTTTIKATQHAGGGVEFTATPNDTFVRLS